MKKILIIPAISFLLMCSVVVEAAVPALAYNCNGVETSVDFHCTAGANNSITSILLYVIDFLSAGAGIAVVIGLIYAGLMYVTSDGDASKTKQAKDIITNAIIGLFLFIFLFAGANFLIPGGLFK